MKRILCVFSFFLLLFPFRAGGEETPHAELLAQKETVAAGESFFLALKIKLKAGEHVYWKNAGDAGEAVELTLNLPDGFRETGRYWLVPERIGADGFVEYGYSGNAAYFPVRIKAPDVLPDGVFEIAGRAVWLACGDECVPMAQDVALVMVARNGLPAFENAEVAEAVASLPPKDETAVFFETPETLVLSANAPERAKTAYFFPSKPNVLTHSAPQSMKIGNGKAFLFLKKAAQEDYSPVERLDGTLVFYTASGDVAAAFEIDAPQSAENLPVFDEPVVLKDFLFALALAFAGGLLLNVMPCVFPVLSLKAFRLIKSGDIDPAARRKSGVLYATGVLASFAAVAGVLIALRSAGAELGWGFQLQYPPFVLGLSLFMFFLGLVFSDIVVIGNGLAAFGRNVGKNWGDFGTGVLAVVVASPCAAPFMGTALGFGLMSPPFITVCVFLAMGIGLAFPFVLLDFVPSFAKRLPKAGTWTVLTRHLLAFPLYGAAAWLLWVLTAQEGDAALAIGLAGLIAVAFASAFAGAAQENGRLKKTSVVVTIAAVLFVGYALTAVSPSTVAARKAERIDWQPYDAAQIQEYRRAGVPVFIKFSAKWCLTCLVNEKTAFSSAEVAAAFRQKGVAAFSADWTNRDGAVTAALESFGRGGIPLYVYYAPHAEQPVLLPQLVTSGVLTDLVGKL